jgi:hypothetical protein
MGNLGFTRVSVLLGIVLAGGLTLLLTIAPRGLHSVSAPEASLLSLQQAIQDALATFIKTKLVDVRVPCANPQAYFLSHSFLSVPTEAQLNADPPPGIPANDWARCSKVELGHAGRFHFCLQRQPDVHDTPPEVRQLPFLFAEVTIQLMDRKSGQPLACLQFLNRTRKFAGASIEYLLVTRQVKAGDPDAKRQRLSFSINR